MSLHEAAIEQATLVVIARPGPSTSAIASSMAERALRACRKPVLLVPSV